MSQSMIVRHRTKSKPYLYRMGFFLIFDFFILVTSLSISIVYRYVLVTLGYQLVEMQHILRL